MNKLLSLQENLIDKLFSLYDCRQFELVSEISSDYDPKIHIWYDEENITKIRALIIGPEGTPYEDGFFYFTIDIPESYPFHHPSAKFETINHKIRFNPNLYEGGKVCLSIIGTWNGPKWSSVQTLKSLLLSNVMQSRHSSYLKVFSSWL